MSAAPASLPPAAPSFDRASRPPPERVAELLPRREWATHGEVEVALGRALWAERGARKDQVLHWTCGRQLLAVVDLSTASAAYRPRVRCEELERAHMIVRPSSAAFAPDDFRRSAVFDLLWRYGTLAEDALGHLPERLMVDTLVIHGRSKEPPVAMDLLQSQAWAALHRHPQKFAALSLTLNIPKSQLARALAPMYISRMLSTRPSGLLARYAQSLARLVQRKD